MRPSRGIQQTDKVKRRGVDGAANGEAPPTFLQLDIPFLHALIAYSWSSGNSVQRVKPDDGA